MNPSTREYRGRFAPSPTGPLHFGSLVAAIASFLQARSQGGRWFVRIEDLDPPREQAGAADDILRMLDAFGLHWDAEVLRQSTRHAIYDHALDTLRRIGASYPCACSRREIADSSLTGIDGPVYPGTCRGGINGEREPRAIRVLTGNDPIAFDDLWQGRIERRIERDYGDFVVRRADGFYAYQLAVVVDDAEQGITEVVRGVDLLESTPRQIHLQGLLGLATPRYAHHPVVMNESGQKLSKQTQAKPIHPRTNRIAAVTDALRFLRQPTDWIMECEWKDVWSGAIAHWRPAQLHKR